MVTLLAARWSVHQLVHLDEVFVQARDAALDVAPAYLFDEACAAATLPRLRAAWDIHELLAVAGLRLDELALAQLPAVDLPWSWVMQTSSVVLEALAPWSDPDPWLAWSSPDPKSTLVVFGAIGGVCVSRMPAPGHLRASAALLGCTVADLVQEKVVSLVTSLT